MAHRATLIPGDGIGPEVVEAARRVIEGTGAIFEWDVQDAGAAVFEREGTALPARLLDSIRERRVALKGPTGTGVAGAYRSANLALREQLDLYAGVRPCRSLAGGGGRRVDVVIVRMNHGDLYAGIEYAAADAGPLRRLAAETHGVQLPADAGVSLKPLSRSSATRVASVAFDWARASGRRRVTAVHKATVMRATDGVFLAAAREVAREYPRLELEDRLVDTFCAELVRTPERFDVVLCPVVYGDIASDIAAALAGGLGIAPGVNLGDGVAVFEAVHGTAPHRAGGRANPMALILSGAMLLRHVGESAAAARVEAAVERVAREGVAVTDDLGPAAARTSEVADAVIARL